MKNDSNDNMSKAETATTMIVAAASKTPFKTAFLITLGIGLGHLALFLIGMAALAVLVVTVVKILS